MTRKRLRQLAAIGLLVLLSASAGCTGMFGMDLGGGQDLSVNPSTVEYDWNTSADVTLNISDDQYRSVYNLTKRQLEVYTLGSLASERPLDTAALKYQYPNGTVITLDASDSDSFYVKESKKRTTIHVPAPKGKVAFITSKSGKSISKPVFVDTEKHNQSYEIVLPPNTGASLPLLSNVHPSGYETAEIHNRIHITWDSVESQNISVRYYLHRDLLIFGGIAAILAIAGLFGAGYYLVQIRKLTRLRKEIGLDIETEDDG
jgi:hypothetical protein